MKFKSVERKNERRGGRSLEGKGPCAPLNHHWKLIRKLAGPGRRRPHRLRAPEHNTGNEVEAKRECLRTDFFALLTPLALKFPHNLCVGCKKQHS